MKLSLHYIKLLGLLLLINCLACRSDHDGETRTDPMDSLLNGEIDSSAVTRQGSRKPGFSEDYVSTNRVLWQKPELVINLLGDLDNKTVADIGAGRGYFALRMAAKAEKVIAVDIDPRFIDYVDSAKTRELSPQLQPRLETRLAKPDDPNLQPEEADIVLIVNTYMYMKNRTEYLKTLKEGISPGGTLLIIDFKKKRTPIGPPSQFRIPLYQVEEELYEAGFVNVRTNDTALDYQYMVMAEK